MMNQSEENSSNSQEIVVTFEESETRKASSLISPVPSGIPKDTILAKSSASKESKKDKMVPTLGAVHAENRISHQTNSSCLTVTLKENKNSNSTSKLGLLKESNKELTSFTKCSPFGYPRSIPKARLAFVTKMVENAGEEHIFKINRNLSSEDSPSDFPLNIGIDSEKHGILKSVPHNLQASVKAKHPAGENFPESHRDIQKHAEKSTEAKNQQTQSFREGTSVANLSKGTMTSKVQAWEEVFSEKSNPKHALKIAKSSAEMKSQITKTFCENDMRTDVSHNVDKPVEAKYQPRKVFRDVNFHKHIPQSIGTSLAVKSKPWEIQQVFGKETKCLQKVQREIEDRMHETVSVTERIFTTSCLPDTILLPFSSGLGTGNSEDVVDNSSILENKDQIRQLWESRTMADGQTAHESVVSNMEKERASENHDKKIIVENGISTVSTHSEVSGKGDAGIHDKDSSKNHNHTEAIVTSEAKEVLVNGGDSSIKTGGTDHEDLLKHENSDEKKNHDEEEISESAGEKDTKEGISEGNEDLSHDSLTTAEKTDSLAHDQKEDKSGKRDESESCNSTQVDTKKNEGSVTIEKEEHVVEKEEHVVEKEEHVVEKEEHVVEKEIPIEEFSAEAIQVVDDTREPSDEPNTEAYYTSSFTFVCQKSHDVEKVDEQKWEEADDDDASEKVEPQEANVTVENVEALEKENAQEIETLDENTDVTSFPDMNETSKSSFVDVDYSESSENALEGETEADYASELSYERTMTGDFQEANDEARNILESHLDNERNENESEIDAGVYDNLSCTTDEEKYFSIRNESATPDSDAELRIERAEQPNQFSHLKRTGVQKTERPYDSGTTESKIAMEIREMREREEELRLMRERMQSPDSSVSSSSPLLSPTTPKQKSVPSQINSTSPEPGPGYRVSTVFGHKGSPVQSPVEEEKKTYRSFNKESAVEKEIRIARSREEELRKEKGLPPREDDSYIKPSQVKSSQVRVFGRMNAPNTSKELATTKIQQEIEEQTLREMALREKGHIQTISQERTDSKVAKLKDLDLSVPECASPTSPNGFGGSFSDRSSKRSTPSPTGSSHGLIPPVSRPVSQGKAISMQKFIASKGKETTFITSRNGPSHPEQNADASRSIPVMRKVKRTVSVESKIQQEILEMKLREEELKRMHNLSAEQSFLTSGENGTDLGEPVSDVSDYVNGQEINGNDDLGPSSNSLIAQWEQRIQKAEGRA